MTTKIYDGKAYDIDTRDIYISSSRRNDTTYPNPNNYTLDIDNTFEKIESAEIVDLQLPYTFYTITPNNNRLYYNTWNGVVPTIPTWPGTGVAAKYLYVNPGYYSASQLASELQRLFNQAEGLTVGNPEFSVIYDASIGKFRFNINRSPTPGGWTVFQLCFVDANGNALGSSMSYEIGFNKGITALIYTQNLIPATNTYASSWKTSGGAYQQDSRYSSCILSNNHVSEGIISHIILRLNNELNGPTSVMSGPTKSITGNRSTAIPKDPYNAVTNYFGVIPINANPGEFITLGSHIKDSYNPKQIYDLPVGNALNDLKVEWYNENGTLLDFNGVEHGFTIRIKFMSKRPAGATFSHPVLNNAMGTHMYI